MKRRHLARDWEIPSNEIASESVFLNRRDFMKASAWSVGVAALSACKEQPSISFPSDTYSETEKKIYPASLNPAYPVDAELTEEKFAVGYNNFFEFGETKESIKHKARNLSIRPWTLEVGGLVDKPQIFDIDKLLRTFPIEERTYRLRCVEAWSIAVPWTGFALNELIRRAGPKSSATHVRFVSFYKPSQAAGQWAFWRPWPYTEGLTLAEAMNELTFLATGIYGRPLPRQNGAPVRLTVPWKYGYKSAKSIVKIELVDYRPPTFWSTLNGLEYDFSANVNPERPHPRWSQAKEKIIGTGEVRATRLYNGYEKFVADLYKKS